MSWLLIIGGVIVALAGLGHYFSRVAGRKAGDLLKGIDQKYEEFVNQYITHNIVNQDNFEIDKEELAHNALLVIKPEIESIIAHINANDYSDVPVKYNSKYFKNIARLAESLFEKRHKTHAIAISEIDEQKLYVAFQDAIVADLTQRMLYLKNGTM
jgi:hypothetical protein